MTLRRAGAYWGRRKSDTGFDLLQDCVAAFSVRKLSASYSGPCMRIRGHSNTTLVDVGFDSNGYVDMATINAYSDATAVLVDVWYDQSGNGNDWYYASGNGIRPVIRIGTTLQQINGRLAVSQVTYGANNYVNMNLRLATKIQVDSSFHVGQQTTLVPAVNYIWYSGTDGDGVYTGGSTGGIQGLGLVINGSILRNLGPASLNQRLWQSFPSNGFLQQNNEALSVSFTVPRLPFMFQYGRNSFYSGAINNPIPGGTQEHLFYSNSKYSLREQFQENINNYYSIYSP